MAEPTATATGPLASSTAIAQMRASIDGFVTGQSTTMLIGIAVVVAAIVWVTRCVARVRRHSLTVVRSGRCGFKVRVSASQAAD